MKTRTLLFLAIGLFFQVQSFAHEDSGEKTTNPCSKLLIRTLPIPEFRNEVLQTNQRDIASARPAAWVSNTLVGRAKEIPSGTDAFDQQVLSLGSGADIYLPIFLYPTARTYHLVDTLQKWGQGPAHVVREIEARLNSMAVDSSSVTLERLDTLGEVNDLSFPIAEPLIWKVSWHSQALGRVEKLVYLHQLNYNHPAAQTVLQKILESDPTRGLAGIIVTGTSPDVETYRFFLARLTPQGSMFAELVYLDSEGRTSTPDDLALVLELEANYQVTSFGLQKTDYVFSPHQYLIQR